MPTHNAGHFRYGPTRQPTARRVLTAYGTSAAHPSKSSWRAPTAKGASTDSKRGLPRLPASQSTSRAHPWPNTQATEYSWHLTRPPPPCRAHSRCLQRKASPGIRHIRWHPPQSTHGAFHSATPSAPSRSATPSAPSTARHLQRPPTARTTFVHTHAPTRAAHGAHEIRHPTPSGFFRRRCADARHWGASCGRMAQGMPGAISDTRTNRAHLPDRPDARTACRDPATVCRAPHHARQRGDHTPRLPQVQPGRPRRAYPAQGMPRRRECPGAGSVQSRAWPAQGACGG
jgi:hypothetical protein